MSKRHERLLFRYSSALERGDFETVADVLREAERDPALERMILDMNEAYTAERFNHTNPKEIPMIAAIYQNQKRVQSRVRWQGLPFVAALAVIALLTVMLAVQTRGNFPTNSGGNDSPTAAQLSPMCSGVLVSSFATVPLHSRPASDAPVVAEIQSFANVGREIVVLDLTSAEGETWVFVRVPSSPDILFGWTTEAQFRTMVMDCQSTIMPTAAPFEPTLMPTLELFSVEATAVAATVVPPPEQFSIEATLSIIPLTPTVMPFNVDEATPVPFADIPQETAVAEGVSIAATDLARFGEGGLCKATTLTTADVFSLPSWDGEVIRALPRGTIVMVGDYATSSDSQGNRLVWYVVGIEDVRGWMLAPLLDTSACPFPDAPTAVFATPTAVLFTLDTVTPLPSGDEPTAQPPTIDPPTVTPPVQALATVTPIPTPTPVQ